MISTHGHASFSSFCTAAWVFCSDSESLTQTIRKRAFLPWYSIHTRSLARVFRAIPDKSAPTRLTPLATALSANNVPLASRPDTCTASSACIGALGDVRPWLHPSRQQVESCDGRLWIFGDLRLASNSLLLYDGLAGAWYSPSTSYVIVPSAPTVPLYVPLPVRPFSLPVPRTNVQAPSSDCGAPSFSVVVPW